jgi:phosphate starvation-inducible membrane PsiE
MDAPTGSGKSDTGRARRVRDAIARGFGHFEDVVYVGLGLLLAYSAGALLVTGGKALWASVVAGAPASGIIELLDRTLLILMIVELLYTVQVSFRAHALMPKPFLVVGLIAATRRILVVTAEFSRVVEKPDPAMFHNAMIEIALLTGMVLALVISLRLLRTSVKVPRE